MSNEVRAEASSNELPEIMNLPSKTIYRLIRSMPGLPKGKCICDSFRKFSTILINMKVQGQEVTPF